MDPEVVMENAVKAKTPVILVAGLGLMLAACTCLPKGQADLDVGMKERGIASWYGEDFHGWLTASGEIYDMESLTGAHRTLPLGTVVKVTNVQNGRQVRVRINDRGPYVSGRILDLSYAAAHRLGMMEGGVSAVSLEVVGEHGLIPLSMEEDGAETGAQLLGLLGWSEGGMMVPRGTPAAWRQPRTSSQYPGDLLLQRRERRADDFTPDEPHV
jgi:rare lipoprotein A